MSTAGLDWAIEPVVKAQGGIWGVVRAVRCESERDAMTSTNDQHEREPADGYDIDAQDEQDTDDSDDASEYASSTVEGRAARQARMSPEKMSKLRRLAKYIREKRTASAMTQRELTARAKGYTDLTEGMSNGLIPKLEALPGGRDHSSDVNLFKLMAVIYAANGTLAELERAVNGQDERAVSEQERRERALLTAFRGLSADGQIDLIEDAQLRFGRELRRQNPHMRDLYHRQEQAERTIHEEYDRATRPPASGECE